MKDDDTRDDERDTGVVPIKERHIVMTPTGITFVLSEDDQAQARACLEKSGKVTINFGEVSVSSLHEIRRLGTRFAPDGGVPPDGGIGPID